jgi:hypothetical protein
LLEVSATSKRSVGTSQSVSEITKGLCGDFRGTR